MSQQRVLLMFGRTGKGKSTLASVIAGEHGMFHEAPSSVSVTKHHQVETIQIQDLSVTIVDTLGLGDTTLTTNEVLFRLADACHQVKNGLHQILFVYDGRFTKEEIEVYTLLRTVIFSNEITKYTTLVRTRFPGFMNADACAKDIADTKNEKSVYAEIIQGCNKVLHVNNLELDDPDVRDLAIQKREQSRSKLLLHIRACSEKYIPQELAQIDERISNHIEEATRLFREKEALEKLVKDLQDSQKNQEQQHLTAIADQQRRMAEIEKQVANERANFQQDRNAQDQQIREERSRMYAEMSSLRTQMEKDIHDSRTKADQDLERYRNEIDNKNRELQQAQTNTANAVRVEQQSRFRNGPGFGREVERLNNQLGEVSTFLGGVGSVVTKFFGLF